MNEQYQTGFGNEFASEAIQGALPIGQNSPQKCFFGLYAEQLSGTAFTAPNGLNRRTWFYRILPSVKLGGQYENMKFEHWLSPIQHKAPTSLAQMRWNPPSLNEYSSIWHSLHTMATAGMVGLNGTAIQFYALHQKSHDNIVFCNHDAETLIIPQLGGLQIITECGHLSINPLEIAVIPRGMRHKIIILEKQARGFLVENYGQYLQLPNRGAIGANGLANSRDFYYPTAKFEENGNYKEIIKIGGTFFTRELAHTPFNVVAWHGNYAPYKYNLNHFNTIGSISFDHPDPSIFTVLTSPSLEAGVANLDFVIFPPRWLVAEHSFRPPWYHRNIMSEFMGNITGVYDAKPNGFQAGGMSLHPAFVAHGPDNQAFTRASNIDLQPHKLEDTMSFMIETRQLQNPSDFAINTPLRQLDYDQCWGDLTNNFNKNKM